MPDTSSISTDTTSPVRAEAAMAVLRAAVGLRRAYEALFQAHGLTNQQFNVLRILRGAERSGEGPLPTMTVGERMIEPEPGITRLMGRLEAKGLIARERCSSDARCVRCAATPAGLAVLAALDGPLNDLERTALDHLTDDEVSTLAHLLVRAFPDPTLPRCPA